MTPIIELLLDGLKRKLALATALVLSMGLAACEHLDTTGAPAVAGWLKAETPEERHPIVVSQQPQTMRLRVGQGSRGLTPQQRSDLLAFADRSRLGNGSNTRVVINAPGGSLNEDAAMEAVRDIRELFASYGTPDSSISVEAYHAAEQREAPIKISVLRYVAEGPLCGQWPENLASNRENTTYYNYGCSNQKNFASMIANPADLEGPRTMDARPGERRDQHWSKYVKGESTGASKSEDEKTNVKQDAGS